MNRTWQVMLRRTLAALLALTATACVNEIDDADDQPAAETARLKVTTRAAADIPYPVQLYAFHAATGQQAAHATLAGGDALTGAKDNLKQDARYLCNEALNSYSLKATTGSATKAGDTHSYSLRGVKRVTVVVRE